MKRFLLALCLASAACVPAPPNLSPQGHAAYTADQVVIRLGEVQNAVIDAAKAGKVKTADARTIVSWISGDKHATPPQVGVLDLLAASPSGWRSAAVLGWPRVKALLDTNPTLAVWSPIVDQLLIEVR